MSGNLTVEQFKKVAPPAIRSRITQDFVDTVNNLTTDPLFREHFRDNILSFSSVLSQGKYKLQSYIEAVKYVSHKMGGDSNINAWVKTFPDRYQTCIKNKTLPKDIASYVSSYNKNQLVVQVFERSLPPTHLLNADIFQKAINEQASIMMSDASYKVRSDAADSLMKHLRPPETKKLEIDIGISEDKTLQDLRETTKALVEQQKAMLIEGLVSPKDVAHSIVVTKDDIVDGEFEDVS